MLRFLFHLLHGNYFVREYLSGGWGSARVLEALSRKEDSSGLVLSLQKGELGRRMKA